MSYELMRRCRKMDCNDFAGVISAGRSFQVREQHHWCFQSFF